MNPGLLDKRVTFRRRPVLPGNARGEFADLMTVRARYVGGTGREAVQSGRLEDLEAGALTVRDTPRTRGLTISDRVMIVGREFSLQAIGLPDRRTGMIEISVSTSRQAAVR